MYHVKPVEKPVIGSVEVPGSKSITNRALLLAGISNGKSTLRNVLFSDDSRHFIACLQSLGYKVEVDEKGKSVSVVGGRPCAKAKINVGSAGTGARFLTAMLSHFEGEYFINASEQMKARPMKPLLEVLEKLGAKITYSEKEGFLPITLLGKRLSGGEIDMVGGEQSSQFLSALLLSGNLFENPLIINPIGKEASKSYIGITMKMINAFGGNVVFDGNRYIVKPSVYTARDYLIEPDVSSACYFFAMAALTGGSVEVKHVHLSSMQGDIEFLEILKQLGCKIEETDNGTRVTGPANGEYSGIEVNMNNCSDQVMTLVALAIFAKSPTHITDIDHMQYQESNRIVAIMTELKKMGIRCERISDGIIIYPGSPKPTEVESYEDHRMAMAFSLVGLGAKGITIINPECTAKTFENYFDVFEDITCQ